MAQLSRLALVTVLGFASTACISSARPLTLTSSAARPSAPAPASGWYPVGVPIVEERRLGADRLVVPASAPAPAPAPECDTSRIGEAFLAFAAEEAERSAYDSRAAADEFARLGAAAAVFTQVVRHVGDEGGAAPGALRGFESRGAVAFERIRVALAVAPAGGSPAIVEARRLAEVQGATLDALTAAREALATFDRLGARRTPAIATALRALSVTQVAAQQRGEAASASLTTHELVSRILAMASRGESPTDALAELVQSPGSTPALETLRASLRTYSSHCAGRTTLM